MARIYPSTDTFLYASKLTTLDKPLLTYSFGSLDLAPRIGFPTACTLLSKIPATSLDRAFRSSAGGEGAGSSLMVSGACICCRDAGRVLPILGVGWWTSADAEADAPALER